MARAKDIVARGLTTLHRGLYRVSGGRVGGTGFSMPVVILTTTGRKSGKRRETVLTTPIEEDGRLVLVASYGGDDHHPAWFLNLRENPDVDIELRGEKRSMKARVASADEKQELWPRVTESYKGYANYQTKTDRDIPLVIVER